MKSNHSLHLLVITTLITCMSFFLAKGQQQHILCGTDIMTQKLLAEHPELLEEYAKNETVTQNYIAKLEAQRAAAKSSHRAEANAPTLYIIPIVFHVLEENGPENISDAQIMSEMKILNEDWGHTNPDTGDAVTAHFRAIEGNMQVQFRLAQRDPNGNCTNGIDRIYTNLTNQANDLSKLNQWDPRKYLNVWVCKSIYAGAAANGTTLGYAYFPFEVNSNPSIDGVLIASYCVGNIGTALAPPIGGNPAEFCRCLSHEIGHVMNLEHPWGLTNSPGVACGDDGVNDTPDTKGYFSICPTGGGNAQSVLSIDVADTTRAEICDTTSKSPLHIVTENFQNFMDYSECSMMFTDGQRDRVWAALNIDEGGRNNLWDTNNLIATGVYTLPVTECTPIANFYSNTCFVCQGASVDFYDASTNGTPTKWDWTFTGASVPSSIQQNPVITFDSLYRQTVSLTVSDSVGSNTKTQGGYVFVSPGWSSYFGNYSEGFENSSEVNNTWLFYNKFNDGINWQYTNAAAATGTGALMLNSFQHIVYNYEYTPPMVEVPAVGGFAEWDAITPSINLSKSSQMTFSFDYSCASEATSQVSITDTLEVDYSLTCGATWKAMKFLTGSALTNAGKFTASYVPTSPSEWNNVAFSVPTGVNNKSNVRFRFKYVSSAYSNNVYIDNVNLNGTVGISPVTAEEYHLLVYPNPASAQATVSYYLPEQQSIHIGLSDIAGRELKELANGNQIAGQHIINLANEDLSNGIYFIKLDAGNSIPVTKKLIVIK